MGQSEPNPAIASTQDEANLGAAAAYGGALDRLARAYEADADKRRDLLQEIHFALWRSFEAVDAQITFTVGEQGKASELVLHQNGANQAARRIE